MAIAAAIFVLLGLALTLAVFWASMISAHKTGHRQIEALLGVGALALLRWGSFAAALAATISAGKMEWVCPGMAGQWILVIGGHLLLGAASVMSLAAFAEASLAERLRRWSALGPMGLPVLLSIVIYMSFMQAPAAALWGMMLVTVPVGFTMPAVLLIEIQKKRAEYLRASDAAQRLEHEKYGQERLVSLEALAPTAVLYQLIQYTYANEPENVCARACELIQARPEFVRELSEALRGDASLEGLWYVAMRLENPSRELAPPLFDGIMRIARDIREKCAAYPVEYAQQFNGECERVLTAVGKLQGGDVDFSPAIAAVLAALNAGDPPSSPYGREILAGWLRGAREGAAA